MNRREAFRALMGFVAASPLLPAEPMDDDVLGPVNVHEFEAAAKRKMHKLAYDFIAGGVEDELTLKANREAFRRWSLVPRFMVDVSNVDMSQDLLGFKLESPLIIAPTGGKNLLMRDADIVVARAAAKMKVPICSAVGPETVIEEGQSIQWWSNTTGHASKQAAQDYARRCEDNGIRGIVVTIDNPYQSNRDRNNRNRFDYGYMRGGVPKPGETFKTVNPARAAMWQPHVPSMSWNYIEWLRGGSDIPILIKGVLHPEDAALSVQRGANAIVVSNHGGRQLDGAIATLEALPDCVDAVGGKIPVLMDGGIRRGSDVLKAMALGAKAVMLGRAPLWGLGAFGQAGVERVLWMLAAETKLSMGLAGQTSVRTINRSLIRRI